MKGLMEIIQGGCKTFSPKAEWYNPGTEIIARDPCTQQQTIYRVEKIKSRKYFQKVRVLPTPVNPKV